MKNKIIIFYQFSNHNNLVLDFAINTSKHGFNIDVFNIETCKYIFKSKPFSTPLWLIIFSIINKIPKVRGVFRKLFLDYILLNISANYNVIDINFLSKNYDNLIKKTNKKLKISIWGSDFLRANEERRKEQKELFEKCDIIQVATPDLKTNITNYYGEFDGKIRIQNYGLRSLNAINDLIDKDIKFYQIPELNDNKKIIITCGYNGSTGQQHEILINALSNINCELKRRIYLIFPMTYGGNNKYINHIEDQLNQINVSYLVLKNHLSFEENNKLRIKSNITINIQKTDAFSGSIQEHLLAENVLLLGEWLPYNILDNNGIFYLKTSIEKLTTNIEYCIINFNKLKYNTKENREKILELSSWDSVSSKFANIYTEIINL